MNNTADSSRRQGVFYPKIEGGSDDPLLDRQEILEAWEVSDRQLRGLVAEGRLRRVRRRGYQPYYPLSAVVEVLGPPLHDPMPPYRSGYEFGELAA